MMVKHNFKIGGKVKQTNPQNWNMNNPMGVVIAFDRYYIRVLWEGTKWNNSKGYPHLPREIECVVKKGEQLMFSFMEEN